MYKNQKNKITTRSLLIAIFIYCMVDTKAQSIQLKNSETVLEMAGKKKSVEYEINLTFNLVGTTTSAIDISLRLSKPIPYPVKFSGGNPSGTSIPSDGQSMTLRFEAQEFPTAGGAIVQEVTKKISVQLGSYTGADSIPVYIDIADLGHSTFVHSCTACIVTLRFINPVLAKNKSNAVQTVKDQTDVFYLNAYNFNLGGSLLSNYLGHFSFFDHNIANTRIGINAGFTFINYSVANSDSIQNFFFQKNLIDPLAENLDSGQKYLKQLNRYVTKPQNSSYSLFLQGMYLLSNPDKKNIQFYVHAHLELLINKNILTTSVTNLKQDTIKTSHSIPVDSTFFRYESPTYSSASTLLNGYFGVGTTFYIALADSIHTFLQGTFGVTTNYPQYASVNNQLATTPISPIAQTITPYGNSNSNPNSVVYKATPKGGFFYYFRGYLDYNLSKSIRVLIGAEIRGLFPKYPPYYAVYVGANLNIASLFNLLKS